MPLKIDNILIDLCQIFASHMDGFEQTFSELNSAQQLEMIHQCSALFNNPQSVNDFAKKAEYNDFLCGYLTKMLIKPSQHYFPNKRTIIQSDDRIIVYYTQLLLLKYLVKTWCKYPAIFKESRLDYNWVVQQQKKLIESFPTLPQHLLNNMQLNTIGDLNRALSQHQQAQRTLLNNRKFIYLFILPMGFILKHSKTKELLGNELHTLFMLCVLCSGLYMRYFIQRPAFVALDQIPRLRAQQQQLSQANGVANPRILNHSSIKKCILITPRELSALKAITNNNNEQHSSTVTPRMQSFN